MRNYNELKNKLNISSDELKKDLNKLNNIANESARVSNIAKNSEIIIEDIENQFCKATKLNKLDIKILFLGVALQCARQYFLTPFEERLDDQSAAEKTKGKKEEKSNRDHGLYSPTLEQIKTNPVPFDAIFGSKDFEDLKLSGKNHRVKTLGHDPILGWIFGTANIVTSTMTTWNFKSYHIETGFTKAGHARDKITKNADTIEVLKYTNDYLFNKELEGKEKIGVSLIKEAIHLKSDINTKKSLPLPIISVISPELANRLCDYGLDVANVETVMKQASYSMLINTLISMIHAMFYDEINDNNWKLYEVRTRKILSYSNVIASTSNIIAVVLMTYNGNKKAINYLDVGGIMVTLYRLISDQKFIAQVQQEFLAKEYYDMIMGSEY